jgi:hypothetical protein
MPGSVTISHQGHAPAVGPEDADRLVAVLAELTRMLEGGGPVRLDDAQVAALCARGDADRMRLAGWLRHVTADLSSQLHHGLGHA